MRIGGKVGAGVTILGLVLGTVQAANAVPPRTTRTTGETVTLITGDRVTLHNDTTISVRPGKGREKMTFSRFSAGGHSYVVPNDAGQLVATGRLDRRLFDISTLIDFGYDDAHRDSVPLIVTGQHAPRAARVSRDLPSIDGFAMAADKNGAAWETLTDDGRDMRTLDTGVTKVWLDGKREASLDQSAPQIGAPAAWAAGYTGTGVKVAVLDTGVDQTHPDLADREVAEQNFSEAPDNVDNAGHGTHVASIVAGTGAKSGGTYRGIADGASILDGKVLDDFGFGTDSGIIAGMEWAAQQGADIANLSLGGPDTAEIDPLEQAVESLSAQYGILFVIAAGNRDPVTTKVASPGSAPSALTVGAVDRDDALAPFSLTGPTVGDNAIKPDVTAPGVEIVAALHSAGTIAPPVADGYTALSGTSMATPHVAGAAALLAQQHPDWTGQQLKAVLSASANPTPNTGVFEQGAGRIDVARALNQTVISEPVSASLGIVAWPHDDDEPVAKTLTYRNLGAIDMTLDLAVADATGPDGSPADVFSLSATEVTVPAGGTASVTVTGDPDLGTALGDYSGTVVATAGESVTRTPVGITREEEKYDLTLNYVDRTGAPTSEYRATVVGLDDGALSFPYDADGSLTVRLPKGRYLVDHTIGEPDGSASIIVQPGVLLDRDRTFDIDAAIAKKNNVTPPTAASLGWAEIAYQVESDAVLFSGGILTNVSVDALPTAQLGDPLPDTTTFNWISTTWQDANNAVYGLCWFLDRFPAGFTKTVGWRELATVRRDYGPGAEGDHGLSFLFPRPASGEAFTSATGFDVALPSTQTMYVTTKDVRWGTNLWLTPDFFPVAELNSPLRSYRAGRTYDEPFNRPVFGPGLPPSDRPWASRSADTIVVNVPLFTDSGDNAGSVPTQSGATKLHLGDQLVGESASGGFGVFPDLPAAAGDYRLTTEAAGPERFGPTTAVSAEWTFPSSHVDSVTALPLNVVRFAPELDANGNAPAGQSFRVPLRVQDETGAVHKPRKISVEVSYDEGATWQRVPVTHDLVARLKHPAGATSVSLRASATDRAGNTVKQTIVRAYTLG